MHTLGAILAFLSVSNAFSYDNKANSSSLGDYSNPLGPMATSVASPAIGAPVLSPDLAERMDPPPLPDFVLDDMCRGFQLMDAMQLFAFKSANPNSPQQFGPLNTPSAFYTPRALNLGWDYVMTYGCPDLAFLNPVLHDLGSPPSTDIGVFHTWILRVGQALSLEYNLNTHCGSHPKPPILVLEL